MFVDANIDSDAPIDVAGHPEGDNGIGGRVSVTLPFSTTDLAIRLEELLPAVTRGVLGPASDHPAVQLPLAQLRLCALLLREGRRTMSQIGDDLGISVSAVTQMADRLEKAGMVERVAETGGDRRTRHLQLTAQGQALMQSRRAARVARAEAIVRTLEPSRWGEIVEVLATLLEASRSIPLPESTTAKHVETHL